MSVVLAVLLVLVVFVVYAIMLTLPVWLAWHIFVVPVFGMPHLTFWNALGLAILLAAVGGRTGAGKSAD